MTGTCGSPDSCTKCSSELASRRQKGLQSTPTLSLSSDFHATEARGLRLRDAPRSSDEYTKDKLHPGKEVIRPSQRSEHDGRANTAYAVYHYDAA